MRVEGWENHELYNAIREAADDAQRKTAGQMSEGFNRVAEALLSLTQEIKALREDLNPHMDKPAKLPAPKSRTTP